jgi:hypothetical protein
VTLRVERYVTSGLRTFPATMGERGESFTRELLVGRGFGCQWARRPMEHRNIYHVAVSPHAVLAIETKFVGAGRQWGTRPVWGVGPWMVPGQASADGWRRRCSDGQLPASIAARDRDRAR